jgi:hypothetical protein
MQLRSFGRWIPTFEGSTADVAIEVTRRAR